MLEADLARERDPYGWSLAAVRRKLKAGEFVGGAPLTIIDLARELKLSPTPVREALARLAGEGVIEDRRGRGYHAWRLEAPDLIELYDLHELVVRRTLTAISEQDWMPVDLAGSADEDPAERVFTGLVEASAAQTFIALHAALTVRLGPVRVAETMVLPDVGAEAITLTLVFEARQWRALSEASAAYHNRRRERSHDISMALRMQTQKR